MSTANLPIKTTRIDELDIYLNNPTAMLSYVSRCINQVEFELLIKQHQRLTEKIKASQSKVSLAPTLQNKLTLRKYEQVLIFCNMTLATAHFQMFHHKLFTSHKGKDVFVKFHQKTIKTTPKTLVNVSEEITEHLSQALFYLNVVTMRVSSVLRKHQNDIQERILSLLFSIHFQLSQAKQIFSDSADQYGVQLPYKRFSAEYQQKKKELIHIAVHMLNKGELIASDHYNSIYPNYKGQISIEEDDFDKFAYCLNLLTQHSVFLSSHHGQQAQSNASCVSQARDLHKKIMAFINNNIEAFIEMLDNRLPVKVSLADSRHHIKLLDSILFLYQQISRFAYQAIKFQQLEEAKACVSILTQLVDKAHQLFPDFKFHYSACPQKSELSKRPDLIVFHSYSKGELFTKEVLQNKLEDLSTQLERCEEEISRQIQAAQENTNPAPQRSRQAVIKTKHKRRGKEKTKKIKREEAKYSEDLAVVTSPKPTIPTTDDPEILHILKLKADFDKQKGAFIVYRTLILSINIFMCEKTSLDLNNNDATFELLRKGFIIQHKHSALEILQKLGSISDEDRLILFRQLKQKSEAENYRNDKSTEKRQLWNLFRETDFWDGVEKNEVGEIISVAQTKTRQKVYRCLLDVSQQLISIMDTHQVEVQDDEEIKFRLHPDYQQEDALRKEIIEFLKYMDEYPKKHALFKIAFKALNKHCAKLRQRDLSITSFKKSEQSEHPHIKEKLSLWNEDEDKQLAHEAADQIKQLEAFVPANQMHSEVAMPSIVSKVEPIPDLTSYLLLNLQNKNGADQVTLLLNAIDNNANKVQEVCIGVDRFKEILHQDILEALEQSSTENEITCKLIGLRLAYISCTKTPITCKYQQVIEPQRENKSSAVQDTRAASLKIITNAAV